MDSTGETTVVEGVWGGGGGDATFRIAGMTYLSDVCTTGLVCGCSLEVSSASASQKARCVKKLSLLKETETY